MGTFKRYNGSSFIKPTSYKRYDGTSWVKCKNIKRYDGISWVSVWKGNKAFSIYSQTSLNHEISENECLFYVDNTGLRDEKLILRCTLDEPTNVSKFASFNWEVLGTESKEFSGYYVGMFLKLTLKFYNSSGGTLKTSQIDLDMTYNKLSNKGMASISSIPVGVKIIEICFEYPRFDDTWVNGNFAYCIINNFMISGEVYTFEE